MFNSPSYVYVCMSIHVFTYAFVLCVYERMRVQSEQYVPVYVCNKCDELYLMWENPRLETGN